MKSVLTCLYYRVVLFCKYFNNKIFKSNRKDVLNNYVVE